MLPGLQQEEGAMECRRSQWDGLLMKALTKAPREASWGLLGADRTGVGGL